MKVFVVTDDGKVVSVWDDPNRAMVEIRNKKIEKWAIWERVVQ